MHSEDFSELTDWREAASQLGSNLYFLLFGACGDSCPANSYDGSRGGESRARSIYQFETLSSGFLRICLIISPEIERSEDGRAASGTVKVELRTENVTG